MRLPPYSPDDKADEPIGKWARQEVTANACLGTKREVHGTDRRRIEDAAYGLCWTEPAGGLQFDLRRSLVP